MLRRDHTRDNLYWLSVVYWVVHIPGITVTLVTTSILMITNVFFKVILEKQHNSVFINKYESTWSSRDEFILKHP